MSDFNKIFKKIKAIEAYLNKSVPSIIGVEAVNHFKKSFDDQGFTDKSLVKWEDVQRRSSQSTWYGFSYGSTSPVPDNHPKRKGAKKAWKQKKSGASTHFSPTATQTKILHSQQNSLKESIKWKPIKGGALVTASGAYAKLLNEGGEMKVFGRSGHNMPKRQFMGSSQVLNQKIASMIKQDIINILNQ